MQYTVHGFSITYDGKSVVTISRNVQPEAFAGDVSRAYDMLACFQRSKPGSSWGCDGVGYHAQLMRGEVLVHKSGVGPRKFKEGMQALCGCTPA